MLPSQPLSPEAMKALAPTVIRRTKESTVLLIPQGATGASPLPGSGADKEVVVSEVGGAQEILQRSENARPEGERRVGHYLHDVGIAVFIYEDKNDSRPSYNDPSFVIQGVRVKAVFVNKLHPSYARCRLERRIGQPPGDVNRARAGWNQRPKQRACCTTDQQNLRDCLGLSQWSRFLRVRLLRFLDRVDEDSFATVVVSLGEEELDLV